VVASILAKSLIGSWKSDLDSASFQQKQRETQHNNSNLDDHFLQVLTIQI
jgi:hypothetical protein